MDEYATAHILTVVRISVKAMHTHNEQTTGIDEGGQQVRAVVATNPLPGERKLETNCL